jgi:signal transduction histidine kinase
VSQRFHAGTQESGQQETDGGDQENGQDIGRENREKNAQRTGPFGSGSSSIDNEQSKIVNAILLYVPPVPAQPRSPTPRLLLGLILILAAVTAYSVYITSQIKGLRELQRDLVDRNRRDSLQLLRIQNDLNQLGLTLRDMLDTDEPYPLTAWSTQFERIRTDLDNALRREEEVAVTRRTPEQRRYLGTSVSQFWDAVDRTFALARDGQEAEARVQIRLSLQARQAALSGAVARLLIENNENEEQAAQRVQGIYDRVQRQVYLFLTATLLAIGLTSFYLIRSNRRLFAQLASLSTQRSELVQKLISARESTLHHISRELHDELGQILTAMGAMLGRAGKHVPNDSPLRAELREVQELAQSTLGNVRSLSQALHPAILDEAGLESALEWYIPTLEKQVGISISYERSGSGPRVNGATGIHVYRVVQEALNNVVRHSGATRAWVRLHTEAERLELDVEDHGKGFGSTPNRGLGIVAMRERAELLGGTIEFGRPAEGGTLVRLRVPLETSRV